MEMVYLSEPDDSGRRLVRCNSCGFRLLTEWPLERVRHMCSTGHTNGPGWHMEKLLKELKINPKADGTCKCFARATEMDHLGVAGCLREFDRLHGWLLEAYDEASIATKVTALGLSVAKSLPKTVRGLLIETILRAHNESRPKDQLPCDLEMLKSRYLGAGH